MCHYMKSGCTQAFTKVDVLKIYETLNELILPS